MSLTPITDNKVPHPQEPKGSDLHPLTVLSLAVSLGTGTGLLAGWQAAVSVFLAVLTLFPRPKSDDA